MSQQSEERAADAAEPLAAKAQVLMFERPQSELQKAVQQRAQETIDRERDRAAAQRPGPWRRVFVLALAAIPVVITFGAAINFVGALQQFNMAVFQSAAPAAQQAPTPQSVPAAPTDDSGVVMLQPYGLPDAPKDEGTSTGSPVR